MGDGQRTAALRFLVGLNWEDDDAFRQDGELRRKANLKGKVINTLSFR